jgi:hypothetical protein
MKHSKKPGSFFVALVLLAFGLAAASPAPAANHNTLTTVIVVDLSGSMAGAKLQYLKEAGKLSAVFLDGTVLLVPFSTSATLDSTTVLSDWPSRVQLMKRFDGLPLGGGTDYLAALRKVLSLNLPRDSRVIFISDGANGNGTDEMVLDLVRQLPGPVHTISIAAGAKAEPLLQAMALRNNGSATRVEQPQQLVEALVALAQRSSEYAAYSPSEVIKQFKGTFSGTVIAIGFNANVRVSGVPEITGPISEHIGNLSERIFVKRLDLGQQTDLTLEAIQQLSPNGRIAKILRNDFNPFGPPRPEHTMAVGVKTDVTVAGNPSPDPNQPNPPPTLQIKNKNTGQIEDSQVAVKGVTPGTWTAGLMWRSRWLWDWRSHRSSRCGTAERFPPMPGASTWGRFRSLPRTTIRSATWQRSRISADKTLLSPPRFRRRKSHRPG